MAGRARHNVTRDIAQAYAVQVDTIRTGQTDVVTIDRQTAAVRGRDTVARGAQYCVIGNVAIERAVGIDTIRARRANHVAVDRQIAAHERSNTVASCAGNDVVGDVAEVDAAQVNTIRAGQTDVVAINCQADVIRRSDTVARGHQYRVIDDFAIGCAAGVNTVRACRADRVVVNRNTAAAVGGNTMTCRHRNNVVGHIAVRHRVQRDTVRARAADIVVVYGCAAHVAQADTIGARAQNNVTPNTNAHAAIREDTRVANQTDVVVEDRNIIAIGDFNAIAGCQQNRVVINEAVLCVGDADTVIRVTADRVAADREAIGARHGNAVRARTGNRVAQNVDVRAARNVDTILTRQQNRVVFDSEIITVDQFDTMAERTRDRVTRNTARAGVDKNAAACRTGNSVIGNRYVHRINHAHAIAARQFQIVVGNADIFGRVHGNRIQRAGDVVAVNVGIGHVIGVDTRQGARDGVVVDIAAVAVFNVNTRQQGDVDVVARDIGEVAVHQVNTRGGTDDGIGQQADVAAAGNIKTGKRRRNRVVFKRGAGNVFKLHTRQQTTGDGVIFDTQTRYVLGENAVGFSAKRCAGVDRDQLEAFERHVVRGDFDQLVSQRQQCAGQACAVGTFDGDRFADLQVLGVITRADIYAASAVTRCKVDTLLDAAVRVQDVNDGRVGIKLVLAHQLVAQQTAFIQTAAQINRLRRHVQRAVADVEVTQNAEDRRAERQVARTAHQGAAGAQLDIARNGYAFGTCNADVTAVAVCAQGSAFAAYVDHSRACDFNIVAADLNRTAVARSGANDAGAVFGVFRLYGAGYFYRATAAQNDFTVFAAQGIGLRHTRHVHNAVDHVFGRACGHDDRATIRACRAAVFDQRIIQLIRCNLDQVVTIQVNRDFLARCQHNFAQVRLQQTGVFYRRCDQRDQAAVSGTDVGKVLDHRAIHSVEILQNERASAEEFCFVRIVHFTGRRHNAAHVNLGVRAKEYTVGVEDNQRAAFGAAHRAFQRTQNFGRVVGTIDAVNRY